MKQALLLGVLIAGLGILGFYGWLLIDMAAALQPLGGIPISLDFFRMNPQLVLMPALGLVLAAAGLNLLLRNRR